MKKTLLALSVAALAASSAQAYNFHVDQTGTDVDFYGSLRVKWVKTPLTKLTMWRVAKAKNTSIMQ